MIKIFEIMSNRILIWSVVKKKSLTDEKIHTLPVIREKRPA